jgi:hypothetical protein
LLDVDQDAYALSGGCTIAGAKKSREVPVVMTGRRKVEYGSDRLYVFDRGTEVGWWDLVRGEGHPAAPDYARVLVETVAEWLGLAADRHCSESQVDPPSSLRNPRPTT